MSDQQEPDPTLAVPVADAERLIRMLKRHLPGTRTCERCGYRAAVGQWGYRTEPIDGTDRALVFACCPSCEAAVRIRPVSNDGEARRSSSQRL